MIFFVGALVFGRTVCAQTADDLFAKFLSATSGWRDLSFSSAMTTNLMGRTQTMHSRIVLDQSGNSYQEILSGPMRVATVVRGDTLQTKDLETGKIETRVLPGGGKAATLQLDPQSRLYALRQANRFQIESKSDNQTVVHGVPMDASKGRIEVKMGFAHSTGMPIACDLLDSTGHTTAHMDFAWEQHGTFQVMKSMKMTTSPSGKTRGMNLEMEVSGIRVNSGLDPATFRLREGK